MEKLTDKLFTVKYNEDSGKPHIEIVDQDVCATKCEGKYCTHFCPAGVYEWNEEQKKTLVSFGNCIECGACSIGCPRDAVPALLKTAKKELKLEKPTSQYLLLRQPNTNDGSPAGMAIYLSDDYGAGGFVDANTKGTVTRVVR